MHLTIQPPNIILTLEGIEKFLAFNFADHFEIPLAHISGVSFTLPKTSWEELRSPGSFFPGLIKAGTYYTGRGKEFWYVTRKRRSVVVIDLHDEKYNRIVVGFPDSTMVQN